MTSKPVHPAAEIFPPMTETEFKDLVADIEQHGLNNPIVLCKGEVLDGRHRLKACQQLGIEPRFRELPNGSEPFAYVVSGNLRRRQLNESQRAMVASKMAKLRPGLKKKTETGRSAGFKTQADAAVMLNVSERLERDAKVVQDRGTPSEIAAVEQGKARVTPTAKAVRARRAKQPAPKAEAAAPPAPAKPSHHIRVPEGMTPETRCREGMALEDQGVALEEVAKQFGWTDSTYRRIRDVVALSDIDLPPAEATIVAAALADVNTNRRITRPYETVKPIVARLWGRRPRSGRFRAKTDARRLEDFEHPFGIVMEVCSRAEGIEIPHLGAERLASALRELGAAVRQLTALQTRLKGLRHAGNSRT